jgi:hypothetical protein
VGVAVVDDRASLFHLTNSTRRSGLVVSSTP